MGFHISRWRYWWGYAVVFLLVLLAIWFTDRAADNASWVSGTVAIALFVILEFVIRLERIRITDSEIEIRRGLFGKSIQRLPYGSVSSVSAVQTFLKKTLRYGDLMIKTAGDEIVLLNFQDPAKIERAVGRRIHKFHETHPHHAVEPHVGP